MAREPTTAPTGSNAETMCDVQTASSEKMAIPQPDEAELRSELPEPIAEVTEMESFGSCHYVSCFRSIANLHVKQIGRADHR